MSKPAVTVESVSKNFRLYHERNRYIKAALLRGRRARFEEFCIRNFSYPGLALVDRKRIVLCNKLRVTGKYDAYEKEMLNANKNATIDDAEQMFDEYFTSKNNTYVTEAGDIEKWDGGSIDPEVIKAIKSNIKRLRNLEI